MPADMHDEMDIGSQCISSGGSDHEYPWISDTSRMGMSSVDWVVTPFGTDVIIDMPDFVIRHVSGCNAASAACSNLKQERKDVKNHAKSMAKSGDPDKEEKMLACDRMQHALKIAASSLCGCLRFQITQCLWSKIILESDAGVRGHSLNSSMRCFSSRIETTSFRCLITDIRFP
jgi:hypothetical protein